jgi:hypothetical protein
MTLYHQVGVIDGSVASQNQHISITGLYSAHLPEDISDRLFTICNTRVDARAPIWVTSLDCGSSLHNYFPLAYPVVGNSAGAVRFDLGFLMFSNSVIFMPFVFDCPVPRFPFADEFVKNDLRFADITALLTLHLRPRTLPELFYCVIIFLQRLQKSLCRKCNQNTIPVDLHIFALQFFCSSFLCSTFL